MSKKDNFEANLTKLEKLVTELESGELGLDKSLEKFEDGLELYNSCKASLEKAEKKITILTDSLKEDEYTD
jgi:exodeoxyribonuclease VII small subunit